MPKTEVRRETLQARTAERGKELLPAEIFRMIGMAHRAEPGATGLPPEMGRRQKALLRVQARGPLLWATQRGVRELRGCHVAISASFARRCAMRANCCQKTVLRAKFWVI